jgi:hypothetical protein
VSLAERLAQTTPNQSGARCTVCRLIVELPAPDNETLRAAVDGSTYNSTQIAEALQAEGHKISRGTVQRHRRGECRGAV